MMVTTSMLLVHRNVDTLVIGYFAEIGAVGVYDVVYTLVSLISVGLSAFGFIFMPVLSESASKNNHEEMQSLFLIAQKWVLLLSLPIFLGLMLVPEILISITFGQEYVIGTAAMQILAFGFLTQGIVGLNGHTLTAIGETRLLMYDAIVTGTVNLGLNVMLVPKYGIIGAAAATTASFFILNLLCSYQVYKKCGIIVISFRIVQLLAITTSVVWSSLYILSVFVGLSATTVLLALPVLGLFYLLVIIRYGVTEADLTYLDTLEEQIDINLTKTRNIVKKFQK
jgi:O-antigen/teichoic acid export membrane protein